MTELRENMLCAEATFSVSDTLSLVSDVYVITNWFCADNRRIFHLRIIEVGFPYRITAVLLPVRIEKSAT